MQCCWNKVAVDKKEKLKNQIVKLKEGLFQLKNDDSLHGPPTQVLLLLHGRQDGVWH